MALALSPTVQLIAEAATCSFCNSEILEKQKIYENDEVVVLYDYKPIIEGHCLVLPKRHVSRLEDLSQSEMTAAHAAIKNLFDAAQKTYESTGYIIFEKNGKEAGQSVPHVHFHFLPRKEGDYSDIGMYARMFFNQFKSPLSQDQIDQQRARLVPYF